MLDINLLRTLKYKDMYDKVAGYVPTAAIDKKTKALIKDIGRYFTAHPNETVVDFGVFRSMFYTVWHKSMKDDDKDLYAAVMTNMVPDASDEIQKTLINMLLELECATDIANLLSDYNADGEVEFVKATTDIVSRVTERLLHNTGFEFAGFEDSTIGENMDDSGYKWPLPIMNVHYRNILSGDSYIVAASQGVGKTTMLCTINRAMAQDMPKNKIIVWLNNESSRQRIMSRQIQAAVQATNSELSAYQKDGTLSARYTKVMGISNRVQVYDIHSKDTTYVEDLLNSLGKDNVGAIIFDMLDNVGSPAQDREDLRLEKLYAWGRTLGVIHDCPIFETSQISNDGLNELHPGKQCLKDSKVGKQGACDGIIMIGWDGSPEATHSHYGLSMPKTKSRREGMGDMRAIITADMDRAMYMSE